MWFRISSVPGCLVGFWEASGVEGGFRDNRNVLGPFENGNAYLWFGLDRGFGGFRGPVNQIVLVGRLSQVEQQTPTAEALNLTVEGSNPSGPAIE